MDFRKHDRLVTIYSFLIEAQRLILNIALTQTVSRNNCDRLVSMLNGALESAKRLQGKD